MSAVARRAITERVRWPEGEILVHGERWESGPDPRREPAWYDDGDPYDEDDELVNEEHEQS
ncbi:hypothetical protein ACWGI9_27235 [Streptomyces sp. NPDC054833]